MVNSIKLNCATSSLRVARLQVECDAAWKRYQRLIIQQKVYPVCTALYRQQHAEIVSALNVAEHISALLISA